MRLTKSGKNTSSKIYSGLGSRSVIGVDISQEAIKLVQLSGRSLNQIQLEKYVITRLPKNVIKGYRIQDHDQLVSYLQQSYAQLQSGSRSVVAALPQGITTIENLFYDPEAAGMDLEQFAEIEVSQLLSNSEINFDYQVVDESVGEGQRVMAVAAKKDDVDTRVDALEAAGLKVEYMDVDVFAQANAFTYWISEHAPDLVNEKVAVIHISESQMHSVVIENGKILYRQESSIGGEQLNQLIQRAYQLTEEQAAGLRASSERPSDYQFQVADRFNAQVAQEAHRVLQFYYTTQHSGQFASVKQVYLTGSASRELGLAEAVLAQTHTPAQVVHPAAAVRSGNIDALELQRDAASLTIAFGLALRGL